MKSKYEKVEDYFIEKINRGTLKSGDRLPPEIQISKKYGYSRMTVNKAMKNLEKQGYVTRIAGRGTFVKEKSVLRLLTDNISLSDIIKQQRMTPGSTLLSYSLADASEVPSAEEFPTPIDKFHHTERLRTGDNKPIALTQDFICSNLIRNIDLNLITGSLYSYLKKLKLPVIQNFVEIKAVKATKKQQKLLNLDVDFLLMTLANTDTITSQDQRVPLGVFISYYNPDLYTYRFNEAQQ